MRGVATLLFLLSAGIAVSIAPDKAAALDVFFLLALGLLVAWGLVWLARAGFRTGVLGGTGLACSALAGLLGAYYLLAHDWAGAQQDHYPVIYDVGLLIQRFRPPLALPDAINPNVLASGLGVLIPLGSGGIVWLLAHRSGESRLPVWRLLAAALAALPLILALGALVLTGSRGGLLALAVGGTCGVYWANRRRLRRRRTLQTTADVLVIGLLALLAGLFLIVFVLPGFGGPLGGMGVSGGSGERATLWREAVNLIGDYRFTGAGLHATQMVLSTYVYILHVGFINHVHNLFLEIAVEQGAMGLVAYLFLVGGAGWSLVQAFRHRTAPRGLLGAIAAAVVTVQVHGLVDAGLYVSRLAPLLFLPLGLAWAAAAQRHRRRSSSLEHSGRRLLITLSPLAVVALIFTLPGTPAALQANAGAVRQSNAELSTYVWPQWPIQDALRRSGAVDLAPAIAHYEAALALDPANVTALRRLGQIALARGQYEAARQYLERAYGLAPDQRATRLLLGEVYAVAGQAEAAAALWRTVDSSQGQLDGRRWWLGQVGTVEQQAAFDQARARLQ